VKLSRKCEYALRALAAIASADAQGQHLLPIGELALRTRIPEKFLEQILLALRNADILRSRRGVEGGYGLNKPPCDIRFGEVIRLIEGTFAPVPCAAVPWGESVECSCPDPETCAVRIAMGRLHTAAAAVLDGLTLEEALRAAAERQQHRLGTLNFDI
jgi:Rrf2 family protein